MNDAERFLHEQIKNNTYLQKDIKSYQKTSSTFFMRGLGNPQELPD